MKINNSFPGQFGSAVRASARRPETLGSVPAKDTYPGYSLSPALVGVVWVATSRCVSYDVSLFLFLPLSLLLYLKINARKCPQVRIKKKEYKLLSEFITYYNLRDCIQKTLNEWSSQISPDLVRELPDVLECTVSHAVEKINPDEREEMKVSAKLFIVGSNSSSTRNAVDMACSVLGVAQLDSVIIASPPTEDGVNLSLQHLQPYWEELENLVQSKKIVAIGTSDLDKTQLEQLYQWAQVKPNSNQVNLASCCVMPPDLTAFAKQFDIQLLTHNDPKELLSEASFQEALRESIPDIQAHEWVPLWLLRYSVIVKSRGIIKSKGYILQAKRRGS
ncbi:glutamate--cysteine ligase regulatory subunit isoform 1-T1 [Molossus nigricans]